MIIANGILLGLVALICFLGGLNLVIKGAMNFLPAETSPQRVLDNLFRFLGGIYFGCGFLVGYSAFHVKDSGNIIYFLGLIVMFSGLGRLYSRFKVGKAGGYFDFVMTLEIILGLSIILLKWLSR